MCSNVAILMAVRNGQYYLNRQLQSFIQQSHKNWSLYVSDDGSTDPTPAMIDLFFRENDGLNGFLVAGPCKGFCQNFLSLINNGSIVADFYAFSDQDDIWLPDKLEKAVKFLETIPADTPALFCSGTTLIDSDDRVVGESLRPKKSLSFQNALLHNIASGNTMVFNNKARELLMRTSTAEMVAHDWSLYQLTTACGGVVHYSHAATVLYRQHGGNQIGDGAKILPRLKNFIRTFSGLRASWNRRNQNVLCQAYNNFTDSSKLTFDNYCSIGDRHMLKRLRYFIKSGVYHQYKLGTLSTLIYVIVRKM